MFKYGALAAPLLMVIIAQWAQTFLIVSAQLCCKITKNKS